MTLKREMDAAARISELEAELDECREECDMLDQAQIDFRAEADFQRQGWAECQKKLAFEIQISRDKDKAFDALETKLTAAEAEEKDYRSLLRKAGPYYSTGDYDRCRWCHNTRSVGHEANCEWLRVMDYDWDKGSALRAQLEQARNQCANRAEEYLTHLGMPKLASEVAKALKRNDGR